MNVTTTLINTILAPTITLVPSGGAIAKEDVENVVLDVTTQLAFDYSAEGVHIHPFQLAEAGNHAISIVIAGGTVDVGNIHALSSIIATYTSPGTKHQGVTITPSLVLEVSGGSLQLVDITAINVGPASCTPTQYNSGMVTCDTDALALANAVAAPQVVTMNVAGTVITAIGSQTVIDVHDVIYVNPGTKLTATMINPSFIFNVSAPPSFTGFVAADFLDGASIGGPSCTISTTFTLTGATCDTEAAVQLGLVTPTINVAGKTLSAAGQQLGVMVASVSASVVGRALLGVEFGNTTVTITTAPLTGSGLTATDVGKVVVGSSWCNASLSGSGPFTAVCSPSAPYLLFWDYGSFEVTVEILGTSFSTGTFLNAIQVLPSFAQASQLAVGATSNFTVFVPSNGGTLGAGDVTRILVGDDSCSISAAPVSGIVSCTITLTGTNATRPVAVTVFGTDLIAGTQVVRAPHTIPVTGTRLYSTNANTIAFKVNGITNHNNLEVRINSTVAAYNVMCTPYDYSSGFLYCNLAIHLPSQSGIVLSARVYGFGITAYGADIGQTTAKPSVNAYDSRRLALELVNLSITGANFGATNPNIISKISINDQLLTPASWTQISNTTVLVPIVNIQNWSYNTPIYVNVTVADLQSSETVLVGIVGFTPSLSVSSRVWGTGSNILVTIPGFGFGLSLAEAAITELLVGSQPCTAEQVVATLISCRLTTTPAPGDHNISITMKGGYHPTPQIMTFADPLQISPTADDRLSFIDGTFYSVLLNENILPFTQGDLAVNLDNEGAQFECGSITVVGTSVYCNGDSALWTNLDSGYIYGILKSGGAPSSRVVIGYLHPGAPTASVKSVPTVGLRQQTFAVTGTNLFPGGARTMYSLSLSDGSMKNCTATSTSSCTLPSLDADLPSGPVVISQITSNGYSGNANVTIAMVLTPNVIYVQFESNEPLSSENISAIAIALATRLNLTTTDFRIDISSGPGTFKRAIYFIQITTITPQGTAVAAVDPDYFQNAAEGSVAEGAPGATNIHAGVSAPADPMPIASPLDPPTEVAPLGSVVPPSQSLLSAGAIVAIIISCVVGVGVIGVLLFAFLSKTLHTASRPKTPIATDVNDTTNNKENVRRIRYADEATGPNDNYSGMQDDLTDAEEFYDDEDEVEEPNSEESYEGVSDDPGSSQISKDDSEDATEESNEQVSAEEGDDEEDKEEHDEHDEQEEVSVASEISTEQTDERQEESGSSRQESGEEEEEDEIDTKKKCESESESDISSVKTEGSSPCSSSS
jgi:hypothetical protein